MNRVTAALLLINILTPAIVHASSVQGKNADARWKAMDKCAQQAQAAFPDFTPEAIAKRDAQLKSCLAGQNLPPRESASPGH